MTYMPVRVNDPDLQEWLSTKKNKSETTRTALKLLYQKEMQEQYTPSKIQVRVLDA